MESRITDQLKQLSKDEEAFKKLKGLFEQFKNEKDTAQNYLELLEASIRTDYDSILITELNLEKPGPKIIYVNDGFCKMTGYGREEVIGKTPRILQGTKTDRATLDKLKQKLKKGQSFFGKAVNYRKDGSEFINQWDIHALTNREGEITHWVSYQHDITERKRAEERLVDTQVDFDRLREESGRTVIDVDLQGNIVMANRSFRELTGYSKDELKQVKIWSLFPQKYRDSLQSRFEQELNGQNFENQQFRGIIKHKTGIPIQAEGKTKVLDLKEQVLIRAEIKNISLQKRVIETLKRRNNDYSRIFEKVSEYTYRVDMKDNIPVINYVSEEFSELTGHSPQAICKKGGIDELVHEEDIQKVKSHFTKVMNGKSCTCEYRIRRGADTYLDIIDYGKPEWENNQVTGVTGAVTLKSSAETVGKAL